MAGRYGVYFSNTVLAAVTSLAACSPGSVASGGAPMEEISGSAGGRSAPIVGGTSSGGARATAPTAWEVPGVDLITKSAGCGSEGPAVAPNSIRRLSRVEYNNSVRDLLGDRTRPADDFVADETVLGFDDNAYAKVTPLIQRQYLEAAERLSETAVSSGLSSLLACDTPPSRSCVETFIRDFGRRAFRSKLDQERVEALLALYDSASAQFDATTGIQAVLTDILSSPRFLFVFERDSEDPREPAPLLADEIAARLSLYLWRSIPDRALLSVADAGQLSTAEQVSAEAGRMLADPRAEGALEDFADQWLELGGLESLGKDPEFAESWSPPIATALHTQTLKTFKSSVLQDESSFVDLLTSPSSYLSSDLAEYYGVPVSSSGFVRVNLDSQPRSPRRAGILTHGSWLAAHAHSRLPSPVLRGKLVREKFLCRAVPPATALGIKNVKPLPSEAIAGETTRDQLAIHTSTAPCSTCHRAMDALGNAFGNFDATGRLFAEDAEHRPLENGEVIDTSGRFSEPGTDLDGREFENALDLVQALAGSRDAQACFAVQQFRYALGRPESSDDACSLQRVYSSFSASGLNLKQLILSIVGSDAFRYRRSVPAGGHCQ